MSTINKEHLWISGKVGISLLCHFSEVEGDAIIIKKLLIKAGEAGLGPVRFLVQG